MGVDKADLKYKGKTFLQIQIEKGKQLGIEEILVSVTEERNVQSVS